MADAAAKPKVVKPVKKQVKLPNTAAARPQVTIYDLKGRGTKAHVGMPCVFLSPIRTDIVNFVHTNMAKNNRQPYGVKYQHGQKGKIAGMQVSARSWGTGRAVSRIPRVRGGGTHRAGQGAFANICKGGRMFAPTKVWRRWHRKINKNQKRYAVASALAASAVAPLVEARGHRIQKMDEIPLVVHSDFEMLSKTKAVRTALNYLKCGPDLRRCKRRYQRAGQGKIRNRRWRHRTGPLIVYKYDKGLVKAARNLQGVDLCRVDQLNLLKLCPGGHVGRLIIWTEPAFKSLNAVFGTLTKRSKKKNGYKLPQPMIRNSDMTAVINSSSVQGVLAPKKVVRRHQRKRNPLKRPELFAKLNPLFASQMGELMKKYRPGAKPTTLKLLRPLRKKQRVKLDVSEENKQKMKQYWDMVIGEPQTKNRETIRLERLAVAKAIEDLEREKAGLDLEEALAAERAGAS